MNEKILTFYDGISMKNETRFHRFAPEFNPKRVKR